MKREFHARFRENVRVKFPRVTRLCEIMRRLINLILIFTLLSCNSTISDSDKKVSTDNSQDTIVRLLVNGISQEFKVNKNFTKRLEKFQEFIYKFPLIPNKYIDTLKIDIDGNKNDDLVISEITKRNNDFTLISTIIINSKIISIDTLETDNELAFMDWNSDSIYFKLKPYTSFYDSYRDKNVLEELENGQLSDDIIDFYTGGVSAGLTKQNVDPIIIKQKIDSIKIELKTYNGKIITSLEHWDRSALIWNKHSEKLEIIYTP